MAVSLSGSGSWSERIAKLIAASRLIHGAIGSTAPSAVATWGTAQYAMLIKAMQTAIDDLNDEYEDSTAAKIIEGVYADLNTWRAAQKTFLGKLKTYATNTTIHMVSEDTPLPSNTIANALAELIRQMISTSDSVNASTVSVSVATDSNNDGDAVCVATVLQTDGSNAEYAFPETIVLEATSDSTLGSTLAQEPFAAYGEAAETDTLSYLWPGGSGASASLTAIDADDADSNILANGSFDAFSTNTPTSWTNQVGTPGTDMFAAGSSDDYAGDNALKFTGTGSTPQNQIWQLVDLSPSTVYMGCVRLKRSSGLAAGVLVLDLYDVDNAAVLADDKLTSNSKSITLSATTTSYVAHTFTFVTPKNMPTTVRFRVRLSTALTNTESIFIDHLAFAAGTLLYTGGITACVFSGATKVVVGDRFTLTVSNSMSTLQEWAERWWGMRALGYQFPSDASGTETISDALAAD